MGANCPDSLPAAVQSACLPCIAQAHQGFRAMSVLPSMLPSTATRSMAQLQPLQMYGQRFTTHTPGPCAE